MFADILTCWACGLATMYLPMFVSRTLCRAFLYSQLQGWRQSRMLYCLGLAYGLVMCWLLLWGLLSLLSIGWVLAIIVVSNTLMLALMTRRYQAELRMDPYQDLHLYSELR